MLFLHDPINFRLNFAIDKSSSQEAASQLVARALSRATGCSSQQYPNHTQGERQKASAMPQFFLIFLTGLYNCGSTGNWVLVQNLVFLAVHMRSP
jgi:hypothetical protein